MVHSTGRLHEATRAAARRTCLDVRSDPARARGMKAKGVGELGICGVAAAVANAVYNACGVRVRDYPITLDKIIGHLPAMV